MIYRVPYKTTFGFFGCGLAAILYAAGYWYPALDRAAVAVFFGSVGLMGYGIYWRFVSVFYPPKMGGKPGERDFKRSKIKSPRLQ